MEITAYNGTAVNGSTGIQVRFGYGNWEPYTLATQLRDRVDRGPQFLSATYGARQQSFTVTMTEGYSGTIDDFLVDVMALFAPNGESATLTARRVAADSTTEVTVKARIISFGRTEDTQWSGTLQIDDPYWQSTTAQTATTSPTTNSGRLSVVPTIAITNGIAATRNRATITDRTGHGIANYPVRIAYASGRAAANLVVYVAGIKAPFWYDSTSGALWVRVNCGPNKAAYVDIYYSLSLNNTVTANTLDLAGLDPVLSTNTAPVWNDLIVSDHPQAAALSWLPANIPPWMSPYDPDKNTGATIAYGLGSGGADPSLGGTYDNTASQIDFFFVAASVGYQNDQHVILLTTPVPFAATNSIVDLKREMSVVLNTIGPQMVVAYRTREDGPWIYAETTNTASGGTELNNLVSKSLTSALNLPGAVQVAIGLRIPNLQQLGTSALGHVRLTANGAGATFTGALESSQVPSVNLSADIAAMLVDGTLLNSTTGDSVVFDALLTDAVTLTLDPNVGSIIAESGPFYSDNIEFTNSSLWFTLKAGANAWSFSGTGDVELSWHERQAF